MIDSLVERLVKIAYPELQYSRINIRWGKTTCFATISWNQDLKEIDIRCNSRVRKWHEAALVGLLSHELSHPAKKSNRNSEKNTDLDVISRGLGVYLAVERILTGKYEDHVIKRGRDRYLGYSSIRKDLTEQEIVQLDKLLLKMRLIPKKTKQSQRALHDMVLIRNENGTSIFIDGHELIMPGQIMDTDVRIVDSNNQSIVYIRDIQVMKFEHWID